MSRYIAEINAACENAFTSPALARDCARMALECALAMARPDLIWEANNLLGWL